jgi:hypothetical protein
MAPKLIEYIIGLPLLGALLLISWLAIEKSHERLDDPNDDRTLYLDELPAKLALYPRGIYRIAILRQSGIIHAERIVTGTAVEALAVVLATFRRAKISAVHVASNTVDELRIGRMYHDHRGRAEGKKVGSAVVTLVEREVRPSLLDSAITFGSDWLHLRLR